MNPQSYGMWKKRKCKVVGYLEGDERLGIVMVFILEAHGKQTPAIDIKRINA